MTVQFLEINGKRMAVLPEHEYERLLELAEDQADVAAYDRAEQRRLEGEEYFPGEMVSRIIDGENPLKVWRTYRGLSQKDLSDRSGVLQSLVSRLESGNALGKPSHWRALAKVLNADVDDIMPDA